MGLGRRLGIPTANLDPHHEAIPPRGVYAVRAKLDGKTYPAVINIGLRPTVKAGSHKKKLSIEVHLLHYKGNLYRRDLEIQFVRRLRDEMAFPTLSVLKEQIQKDIRKAQLILHLNRLTRV
jgi:riboflavin kinase/FMN adenylyltransferase